MGAGSGGRNGGASRSRTRELGSDHEASLVTSIK